MTETVHKGLNGVVVDFTAISKVMQDTNSLTYRGYAVQDLAAHCRFDEVAWLIWHGDLPNAAQLAAFQAQERSLRTVSPELLALIASMPKTAHPMDAVRTAVSWLGLEDANAADNDPAENLRKSILLYAKLPTIVAALSRHRRGLAPIAPDDRLGYSENFFQMCFGTVPDAETLRCFDISLILYAEHSFNASTFSGRVIISSLSDIYGAVTGAIASLKGPLHGGANEAVMHDMLEIGTPDKAQAWIDRAIAEKRKIMGFGHRVYKNGDSRVPTMRQAFEDMARRCKGENWLEMADILQNTMIGQKGIHPNLDFPTGPAYYLMGFEIEIFTPIFVMSRIIGWTAHIMEQLADNRLIRPLSAYNGVAQRSVVPLGAR